MRHRVAFVLLVAAVGHTATALAQNDAAIRIDASLALQRGNQRQALSLAEEMLKQDREDARVAMLAADIFLRCGEPARALPLYDQYLAAYPEAMPRLWQRGIALYFVGQFQLGAQQFEAHREVNPHDVENAAWHLLCVSKAESFDKAKASVLPAPGDPRVPMAEVQQMLASGDTSLVVKRMQNVPADTPEHAAATFYGNFYLGLYADAQGDRQTALTRMSAAAKDAPHHYMGDVARVYAKHLAVAGDAKSPPR